MKLRGWDVSNVRTQMKHMFQGATAFNQDIGDWNTVKMEHMFESAANFNQDIGDWNTSKVNNMTVFYAMVRVQYLIKTSEDGILQMFTINRYSGYCF